MEIANDALRTRSGSVVGDSVLVEFLYVLLRDELPAGKVEELVRSVEGRGMVMYTNGWLAKYAEDLASRLTSIV
jgi:hypothetical protein